MSFKNVLSFAVEQSKLERLFLANSSLKNIASNAGTFLSGTPYKQTPILTHKY